MAGTLGVTGNTTLANASTTNISASGEGFFATASTTNLTTNSFTNNGVAANSMLYLNGSHVESAVTLPSYVTLTSGTLAISALPIADLAADTISGVSLGGTLANLSAGTGLSGSAYNGSGTQTFSLNLANANKLDSPPDLHQRNPPRSSLQAPSGTRVSPTVFSPPMRRAKSSQRHQLAPTTSQEISPRSTAPLSQRTAATPSPQRAQHSLPTTHTFSGTNTFSGNNLFSASTTFSNLLNLNQASSSLLTVAGNTYLNILNVTGKTTLANASSTVLSVSGNSYLGTAQSTTFAINSILSCSGSQALQTDGSGNLSCGAISISGASTGGGWSTNNIGRVSLATSTDLVAIGATTTPYAKLTVVFWIVRDDDLGPRTSLIANSRHSRYLQSFRQSWFGLHRKR